MDVYKDVLRRQRYEELCEGEEGWVAQVFSINLYMGPRGVEYEYSGLR